MFGSCGTNTKCGLGEIALNKITVLRKQKGVDFVYAMFGIQGIFDRDSQIVLTSAKLLRGISFSQKRDLSIISYDRTASIGLINEQFVPETLSLQINYIEEVEQLKRFLRDKNSTYILKLDFQNKTMFCNVALQGDTVGTYTILDKWSIDFLRTSMYYKVVPITLTDSRAVITNAGDAKGALQVYGTVVDPEDPVTIKFYWSQYPDPLNSHQRDAINMLSISYATLFSPYVFDYSSVPGDMYINSKATFTGAYPIDDLRDFATKGYVEVPYDSSILEITNVSNVDLMVNMYEYYYNI